MTNPIFAAFRARVWRAASRSGALLFSTLLFCAAVQAQEVAGEVVLVQGPHRATVRRAPDGRIDVRVP